MQPAQESLLTQTTYPFQVGAFNCTVISDGTFTYPHPADTFFANAAPERLQQLLQPFGIDLHSWEQQVVPYLCLLVDTGEHRVLIDTGAGDMAPSTGHLQSGLRGLGIAPQDIDTVILTHGHIDHIGGSLDHKGQPAYLNARYIMAETEWEFWATDPDLASLDVDEHVIELLRAAAHKNLSAIAPQLELVEDGAEIVPGIRAVEAPGHTPGHMALKISSGGQQLLCAIDVVTHPIHVQRPEWTMSVDLDPAEIEITRRHLLGRAAVENSLVFTTHFPFPGLGHVVLEDNGWQWQPL